MLKTPTSVRGYMLKNKRRRLFVKKRVGGYLLKNTLRRLYVKKHHRRLYVKKHQGYNVYTLFFPLWVSRIYVLYGIRYNFLYFMGSGSPSLCCKLLAVHCVANF